MKNLLKYFEHHKKATVIAPLFKLLEAFFDLLVPLVVAQIIDVGIVNRDTGYIYLNIGLLILLALVGFACSITAQYFAARVSSDVGTDIRQDMFDHIEGMPAFRHLRTSSSNASAVIAKIGTVFAS